MARVTSSIFFRRLQLTRGDAISHEGEYDLEWGVYANWLEGTRPSLLIEMPTSSLVLFDALVISKVGQCSRLGYENRLNT